MAPPPASVTLVELRVLDGPNLYFPRPAIKLTLATPGWMALPEQRAAALAERLGLHAGPGARPGAPGTVRRRRARPGGRGLSLAASDGRRDVRPGGGRADGGRPRRPALRFPGHRRAGGHA